MRHLAENPFILGECAKAGVDGAPIPTRIYETYAQCNEDLIVESILRVHMRRQGRPMSSVRYLEIGANHPIQTSSSYLLYRLHGARGVLVEAIPALARVLDQVRPGDTVVTSAVTHTDAPTVSFHVHEKNEISSVLPEHIGRFTRFGGAEGIAETITCPNLHINQLIDSYAATGVDFMSIDIEGVDLAVLDAMRWSFAPSVLQCEHSEKIEDYDALLRPRGYRLHSLTDVNAIFVHESAW